MVREITRRGYRVVQRPRPTDWLEGRQWPRTAETMVGLKRLRNIRECVEQVLEDQIPGDLIETGVWRGGSCIYMRAILAAHEISDRTVWVADSFEGLPPPTLPQDEGLNLNASPELAVGVDEVRANFERYGLLDDQVQFLIGWFADTLPGPVKQLALLRLDGDLYESTWDAVAALEPYVSRGGFVIVDDYGLFEACRQAVHDYRTQNEITVPHRADRPDRRLPNPVTISERIVGNRDSFHVDGELHHARVTGHNIEQACPTAVDAVGSAKTSLLVGRGARATNPPYRAG